MKRRAEFDSFFGPGWPSLALLRPYFMGPGPLWFDDHGNDSAVLSLQGLDETDHLLLHQGRKDVQLAMWGKQELGVLLIYTAWGFGPRADYTSRGDLTRLSEIVRSAHDTPLPVGLFVAFDEAWKAVKEFIETDGALPKSIAWIANRDLPPETFPDP